MKRFPALLLLLSCAASAQDHPGPSVQESALESWDIPSLKAGEWVSYEARTTGTPRQATWRMACVGVEGGVAFIETDLFSLTQKTPTGEPVPAAERVLVLAAVDRETRKIKEAWWGTAGKPARPVKLVEGKAPGQDRPAITGTGRVSPDRIKVAGTELDCERIELDSTSKGVGYEVKSHSTTWVSDQVSFRTWSDERRDDRWGDIKWEKAPESRGGVVRVVTEASGARAEIELTGFGTDAKATLKRE